MIKPTLKGGAFDLSQKRGGLRRCKPTMERIAELIAVMFPILGVVRVEVWRPTLACGAIWERNSLPGPPEPHKK
jgi:hypothetical protein